MKAQVENFRDAINNLQNTPAELILAKAKEAYSYCFYAHGRPAHLQDKGCTTEDIARLKGNQQFKDSIHHRDGSTTLITTQNFYLKFNNR